MKQKSSSNKCLILGGSSEIGLLLAKRLFEENITPIITYSSEKGLKKIREDIKNNITTYKVDLSSLNSIYDFFSKVDFEIQYFVDLAHTNEEELFLSLKDEEIISYYTTNVINRSIFIKHLVRSMLPRRKGRLIYISSTAANIPNIGQGIYCSSKLAVEGIYKIIGIEMYKKGISTLILRPGYINSGRSKRFIQQKNNLLNPYLLDKDDIVDAIIYFLKDNGRCFNAREITMDRGFFAQKIFY